MISSAPPCKYVPLGLRRLSPECSTLHVGRSPLDNTAINERLKQSAYRTLSINRTEHDEIFKQTDRVFRIRKSFHDIDEELWASQGVIYWSRMDSDDVYRKFSVDFAVIDAFWCHFEHERAEHKTSKDGQLCVASDQDCICVVGCDGFEVFLGHESLSILTPFKINRVWPTSNGLLVERQVDPTNDKQVSEPQFPLLFSLAHPLNEFLPVVYRPANSSSSQAWYVLNRDWRVVFVSAQPPLVLSFNVKTGAHSLWRLKEASAEEARCAHAMLSNSFATPDLSSQPAVGKTPSSSRFATLTTSGDAFTQTPSGPRRTTDSSTNSLSGVSRLLSAHMQSPVWCAPSANTLITPPLPRQTRIFPNALANQTPDSIRTKTMQQSPALARLIGYRMQGTPLPATGASSPSQRVDMLQSGSKRMRKLRKTPDVQNISEHSILDSSVGLWPAQPLIPDICLDHVWTESASLGSDKHEVATKCFVTEDFVGQQFFFYLLCGLQQLRCLKIYWSTDKAPVIGTSTTIDAVDVTHLEGEKLVIVLDKCFDLVLYSGITKIAYVYLDTSVFYQTSFTASTIVGSSQSDTPLYYGRKDPRVLSSTQRSTPLQADIFSDRETISSLISPVLSSTEVTPELTGSRALAPTALSLVGGCGLRYIVKIEFGRMYRSQIPPWSQTAIVKKCLKVLSQMLSKDVALNVVCRWYAYNNSPMTCLATELQRFFKFLMDLMGFPTDHLSIFRKIGLENSPTPVIPTKKSKCSSDGSNLDWDQLREHTFTKTTGNRLSQVFGLFAERAGQATTGTPVLPSPRRKGRVSTSHSPTSDKSFVLNGAQDCLLFNSLPTVFYALHLVYEGLKLDVRDWCYQKEFSVVLHCLSRTLKLESFSDLYVQDCSDIVPDENVCKIADGDNRLTFPPNWSSECTDVYLWIRTLLQRKGKLPGTSAKLPVLLSVDGEDDDRLLKVVLCFGILTGRIRTVKELEQHVTWMPVPKASSPGLKARRLHVERCLAAIGTDQSVGAQLRQLMSALQLIELNVLHTYPHGLTLIWLDVLHRHDLLQALSQSWFVPANYAPTLIADGNEEKMTTSANMDDGMGELMPVCRVTLSMKFPNDLRVAEARRMLCSSRPVKITLKQQPTVSDHDFREEQEKYLYSVCMRTLALPVGRGMMSYGSKRPLVTECVPIPPLSLTGISVPKKLTIELNRIELAPNMEQWALFHNGVAAALKIAPSAHHSTASALDSHWIVYNMPKPHELSAEHAGYLLGLGLNGHLARLGLFNFHNYMIKGDAMTSLALLIGIAAAKYGSADLYVMKMLSIHMPFLLPPTLLELNIDPLVQTAAVAGLGLLYAETSDLMLTEVLLREIGKLPCAESEVVTGQAMGDRETYALVCGLALGMINLGQGNILFPERETSLADQLLLYLQGGHRKRASRSSAGFYGDGEVSASCNLVKEGDLINVDVTGPAATVALGLAFLKSHNDAVARWLEVPDTLTLLDSVRPDFLLLRVLCRSLILWNDVLPSRQWVESQLPSIVKLSLVALTDLNFLQVFSEDSVAEFRAQTLGLVDWNSVAQAYCNVVAGACLAIGFRYAGSCNASAFGTLMHYCKSLIEDLSENTQPILVQAGSHTIDMCLNAVIIALSMVMAGSGNLDIMRLVRRLRRRLSSSSVNHHATCYGTQTALHMALGLLFLGSGRYSLCTDNRSIAAMLTAFYPTFPASCTDNKYHLQALRHLYVLACEPRLVLPYDVQLQQPVTVYIRVKFRDTKQYSGVSYVTQAPCLLPELHLLEAVEIDDERYASAAYTRSKPLDWKLFSNLLREGDGIWRVHRKPGWLPRKDDPKGFKSLAAISTIASSTHVWRVPNVEQETMNASAVVQPIVGWSHSFRQGSEQAQQLVLSLEHYVTLRGYVDDLPFFFQFLSLALANVLHSGDIWQLKLLQIYNAAQRDSMSTRSAAAGGLVHDELLKSVQCSVEAKLMAGVDAPRVRQYLGYERYKEQPGTYVGEFLTYFDVDAHIWRGLSTRECCHLRTLTQRMLQTGVSVKSLVAMIKILRD